MMDSFQSYLGQRFLCPFCGHDECRHFIGWTEDGHTLEPRVLLGPKPRPVVLTSDICVNTGITTRVYRDWFFP